MKRGKSLRWQLHGWEEGMLIKVCIFDLLSLKIARNLNLRVWTRKKTKFSSSLVMNRSHGHAYWVLKKNISLGNLSTTSLAREQLHSSPEGILFNYSTLLPWTELPNEQWIVHGFSEPWRVHCPPPWQKICIPHRHFTLWNWRLRKTKHISFFFF